MHYNDSLMKKQIFKKIRAKYFPLIKSLQTGLLLITGLAGSSNPSRPVCY